MSSGGPSGTRRALPARQASSIRAEVAEPVGIVEHGVVQRRQDALERALTGCAAISAAKVCRGGASMQRRPCRWTRGATSPVSRRRCFKSRTHDPLTRDFAATSAAFIPASLSRSTRSRRSIEEARIGPPASVRAEVPRPPQGVQGLFKKRSNAAPRWISPSPSIGIFK